MTLRASLLTLAFSLAAAACVAVVWHVGMLRHWDWRAAYLSALAWAFVFWNSVRILTYVPTLRLLLQPGASAAHYSVATWASWVFSNATLALYLFETGGRTLNSLVLLNAGNALMCLVTCALIVRLRRQRRLSGASRGALRAPGHNAGDDHRPGEQQPLKLLEAERQHRAPQSVETAAAAVIDSYDCAAAAAALVSVHGRSHRSPARSPARQGRCNRTALRGDPPGAEADRTLSTGAR